MLNLTIFPSLGGILRAFKILMCTDFPKSNMYSIFHTFLNQRNFLFWSTSKRWVCIDMRTGSWIIEAWQVKYDVKIRAIERGNNHLRSLSCEHTDGNELTQWRLLGYSSPHFRLYHRNKKRGVQGRADNQADDLINLFRMISLNSIYTSKQSDVLILQKLQKS